MKIYTKKGDKGQTSLANGMKVGKDDLRIEVLGELDELNCQLGVLLCLLSEGNDKMFIEQIQSSIFSVSSHLLNESFDFDQEIHLIETEIDTIQPILPPQRSFLLPGGSPAAAHAHVCRAVCRRVERHAFALSKCHTVHADVLKYLNRLSDYLYVLSRKINFENGIQEKIWQNSCR